MDRKTLGIIFIVLGILMIVYTGFTYVTTERVVDLGPLKIDKNESHPIQWSPIVGVVLLVGGLAMTSFIKKN